MAFDTAARVPAHQPLVAPFDLVFFFPEVQATERACRRSLLLKFPPGFRSARMSGLVSVVDAPSRRPARNFVDNCLLRAANLAIWRAGLSSPMPPSMVCSELPA
jgi:hypothetical protein